MSTTVRVSHNLARVGKEIHQSPLPSTERFCLITMPDGSSRLGLTQITSHVTTGPSPGQNFGRVSFRFCDREQDQDNRYDESFDTAWFLVDHRHGKIQFGPAEGLRIRARGQGIGCYLIGQLLRLLSQANIRGQYQVEDFNFTDAVEAHLPPDERAINRERAEAAFGRAGFFISQAGGELIVGARRSGDLKPNWNSDRIRFLNITQMAVAAGSWLSKSQDQESEIVGLKQALAALEQAGAIKAQQSAEREAALRTSIQELQEEVASKQSVIEAMEQAQQMHAEQLEAIRAELAPSAQGTAPAAQPVPGINQVILKPSRGLMWWLWGALTVGAGAVVIAAAGVIVR
ncbi:hypothetical protein ACEP6V_21310 [Pseudomonas aeruginosa]|uniref:hypothetical protein n=1 Tax=Pseudomonas aeruginosa TaxID=287 RepID=UPI0010463FD4|nr:hypothetical protein [Pseudomonas aeruginosa]